MLLVHVLHLSKTLVSVDHQDGGGEGILAGDEPVLVEAVQLLDVLQRDCVLLRPHPHVNPLQRLLGRGAEVDDHVQVHNERQRAVRPGQELEPLVENFALAADDRSIRLTGFTLNMFTMKQ